MVSFEDIVQSIVDERAKQVTQWGEDFDDRNTVNDWVATLTYYVGKASNCRPDGRAATEFLKVAAVAIAAIEAFGRNGGFPERHFD